MFTVKGKVIAVKPYKNKEGEYKADSVVVETDKGYNVGFAPLSTLFVGDDVTVITACEDGKWSVKFVR